MVRAVAVRQAATVNFIGHATVALWARTDPGFVLGSMLPDFATMAGARLRTSAAEPGVTSAQPDAIVAGVAFHHHTDEVFHALPTFTRLSQLALEELSARGLARGPARAVGHIGVEMLADGEFVRSVAVAGAYVDALAHGEDARALFRTPADAERYERLRLRLLSYGPPHDYRQLDSVASRLVHVLRARPRLALDEEARSLVRTYLPALQEHVVEGLPTLLAELRAALRCP